MSPRAREAFVAALDEGWADPERLHSDSRRARALLEGAREAIAAVLGSSPEHTQFVPTFGLAFDRMVAGVAAARRGSGTVAASAIERRALLRCADRASEKVDLVGVDEVGVLDLAAFTTAVAAPGVSIAAVQHANQEVGTVQDLAAIHAAADAAGVPLLVDATSSIGHIDPPAHWDALAADAADWGGPRGIAVLAFRPGTRKLPVPPIVIDKVSVPAALAAAVALEEREEQRAEVAERLRALTGRIRAHAASLPGGRVFGHPALDNPGSSLPHVVTFAIAGIDGEALASELDRAGFSVGTGSACIVEASSESHVLEALGAPGGGNIRIGLHPGVTDGDVTHFLSAVDGAAPRPKG